MGMMNLIGDWVQRHIAESISGIWTFTNGLIGNLQTAGTTAYMTLTANTIQAAGSDNNVDVNIMPKGTGGVISGGAILSNSGNTVPSASIGRGSFGSAIIESSASGTWPSVKFNGYFLQSASQNRYITANAAFAVGLENSANRLDFSYAGIGVAGNAISYSTGIVLTSAGKAGFLTTAPDKQVEINSSDGNNLRLTYNDSNGSATNYCDLLTTSSGDLTVTPSGKDATFNSSIASNYASDSDFDNGDVLSTGIASGYGLLVVKETVTGKSGVFRIENQTIHIVDADASFSITKDAPSINIYWETDQFKIQNASTVSNYAITVGLFAV